MSVDPFSLNMTGIIAKTIQDYDLKDDHGESPTDDLYMIRSSQLDELAFTAATRISKKAEEIDQLNKVINEKVERRMKEERHARSDD